MSLDPSWRPQEDAATILNERTWLAGIILSAVAYGIVFTLFMMSFVQLIRTTNKRNLASKLPLIIYISLIFILGTLIIGSGSKMTQLSFIDYRNIPGGPATFEEVEFSIPVDEVANVAYVLANWFADGMVVYRCMVIYRGCRFSPYLVMGIPAIAYLGSVTTGILWLTQISATSPWVAGSINFTAPYFWLSLALNMTMTIAICARLLVFRRRMVKVLGGRHGSHYTSIAAMLVESAAIYSVFSLCFLVPFALNHPIQNTFIQMLGEVQIIAPLLITYRVAYGKAWTDKTTKQLLSGNTKEAESVSMKFIKPLSTVDASNHSNTLNESKPEGFVLEGSDISQMQSGRWHDKSSV
ncbi:hypothetical protein JR316_0009401 [Psilocybe cubensis]|uniref:Uncharacterized protein n=2 Tax=Psilocybe cubensis TaxID=181762 RepID=A0ACB8GT76_PSICU|nr:hypothetical protein JR316_0009401 [Psilocybe cubensis]KAH9478938.1 hypothetical protein JR316_0009401 [Psilocybe cubensis]